MLKKKLKKKINLNNWSEIMARVSLSVVEKVLEKSGVTRPTHTISNQNPEFSVLQNFFKNWLYLSLLR